MTATDPQGPEPAGHIPPARPAVTLPRRRTRPRLRPVVFPPGLLEPALIRRRSIAAWRAPGAGGTLLPAAAV